MIYAIVAVDNNWGIGFNGDLLERIPEDMKHFKSLTDNHMIVMGRKTWESLPGPLPNRFHLILTRNPENDTSLQDRWFANQSEGINMMLYEPQDVFVIGGGTIFNELLPFCDRVYVTKIYKNYENVDTFFPNLDTTEEWEPEALGSVQTYNDLTYQFWLYSRKIDFYK